MVISAVMIFEKRLSLGILQKLMQERLIKKYPVFSKKPVNLSGVFSGHEWRHYDEFAIEDHIISAPSLLRQDEAALQELISLELSKALPSNRALWRFMLVEEYGLGSAMIIRVHHSIADGFSLIKVLFDLIDESSESPELSLTFSDPKRSKFFELEIKPSFSLKLAHSFFNLFRVMWQGVSSIKQLVFSRSDQKSLLTNKIGVIKKVTWTQPMDLDEIKNIAKNAGATVNDIMVTIVSGALHRYMHRRDALIKQVRTAIPVNLRKKIKGQTLGNKFGLVFLTLPIGEKSAAQRLEIIRHSMKKLKNSTDALMSKSLLSLIGYLPVLLEHRLINMFARKVSSIMSNVPGPQHAIFIGGVKVTKFMFWPPKTGDVGLGFSIFSYNKQISIGISADVQIIKDPVELIEDMREEFLALKKV